MAYEIEDEVDWSDGTIDESPPSSADAPGDSGYVSAVAYEDHDVDDLFELQEDDDLDISSSTALPEVTHRPTSTRAQRARLGAHLNRKPSEQDYLHFALYQANQKAYEATFLKHFVYHALHPAQIEECFRNSADACSNVQKYITAVSANISDITKKMTWNAHCRAVNLLRNAGKEGAPFWDIAHFDQSIFQDFVPDNTIPITHRMNESWHRTSLQPVMVRYTTRQYPLDHHSSPFEEINDVSAMLFDDEAFGQSLPTGRSVKPPSARKGKGQGLAGARVRDPVPNEGRDNWLASLIPSAKSQERDPSPPKNHLPDKLAEENNITAELESLSDPRLLQKDASTKDAPQQLVPAKAFQLHDGTAIGGLTQLERLYEKFGDGALGDHCGIDTSSKNHNIEQVPIWSMRFLNDHKRRVTQRSPQILRRELPGIRAVIAEALLQGYRPTDPNLEELVTDIETREQANVVSVLAPKEVVPSAQKTVQVVSKKQTGSQHGKKRKRDQPGIRMLNRPVKPSRKKRKTDTTVVDFGSLSQSMKQATSTLQENIGLASALYSEPRQLQRKSAKQKATVHRTTALVDGAPLPPHPSGSTTLEPHQQLPPTAYFTPKKPSEKPVWRCSVKHAMGHYYNAGDRKSCPGCFTTRSDNINAKVMDFYLPSRTHFHQPNPDSRWRPSKPFGRVRRCTSLSHNSIAKEAYWSAIAAGSIEEEALHIAVNAVTEHLKSKLRKEPPAEPTPEPEPEPDLGPHPSGSTAMEHGQDLPDCAYFSKREQQEELAWRCDVNHALGRYYLAGDKRTCPGCGSNKNGKGKHITMDFFLPTGIAVRQEVGNLKWKPKKPYKVREGKFQSGSKKTTPSHNQMASKKYWAAIEAGKEHTEALNFAIEETDHQLDEKEADTLQRVVDRVQPNTETPSTAKTPTPSTPSASTRRGRNRRHPTTSEYGITALYPASYGPHSYYSHPSDDETDGEELPADEESESTSPTELVDDISSDDETSSGSDSE
ncbi:hypothetical protein EKO04_004966 [Ascochyta lentis]|uniref:Uncharacterized protein n=1 Tax=Ascochyta lentis TaxID=205686 RepID=A0A8H7MJ79_9PLEO|nr:hypothetical protein EKO04_004966 [Ascochyta lentis]